MISNRMHEAINAQINAEMWSAYLYLAMSLDAAETALKSLLDFIPAGHLLQQLELAVLEPVAVLRLQLRNRLLACPEHAVCTVVPRR